MFYKYNLTPPKQKSQKIKKIKSIERRSNCPISSSLDIFGDRWSLLGYLDVGQGSATSSWQAIAGASYQYSPTTSLKFGYRYLYYKRDDALLYKAAMGGLYFGAGFKF